jgi:hypothetical protein
VRVCLICGESIEQRRSDALTCSPACRRERRRLQAILSGRGDGPYASVAGRLHAAGNRANGATGGVLMPHGPGSASGSV